MKNMQCILNYYRTAKQHGLQEIAINFDFIQMYSGKLSKDQKKSLIDQKIETCVPFIAKIKDYQRTNLQFLHTTRATQGAKTFQYVNRPDQSDGREPDPPVGRQPSRDYRNPSGSRMVTRLVQGSAGKIEGVKTLFKAERTSSI